MPRHTYGPTEQEWQAMYARLRPHWHRIHTHESGLRYNMGDVVMPVWRKLTWELACELAEQVPSGKS